MTNYLKHLHTINKHKYHVFKVCYDLGIPWRGLVHDLSKYSFKEFVPYAKYFQPGSSPAGIAKKREGFFLAWNHHKGHNRHHPEWWMDIIKGEICTICPEWDDVLEMFADWIGAGIAYNPEHFDEKEPLRYFLNRKDLWLLHPTLIDCATYFLTNISEHGYRYAIDNIDKVRTIYINSQREKERVYKIKNE